ncbi:MAG: hypothetical protein Q7S22_04900 [Candidatus Micrarchaeota archaeon]|nr:hypothetical protein [Candidatus Micrarchaeota archaeon]
MKSITVIADDRVGLLADISYLLGKAKINIESIGLEVVAGKAVMSLTLKDPEKAKTVLEHAGYEVTETNMIVVKLNDQPGELGKITSMMAQEKINIENIHMLSKDGKATIIAIKVDKPKRALKLLEPYLVNREELTGVN